MTIVIIFFSGAYAQITDPIPEPIRASGISVTFQQIVKIPESDGKSPLLNFISTTGDGSKRLFVNDQRGKLYVLRGDNASVYLDITDVFSRFVRLSNQSGFTYFAFHPEFATNRNFYTVHSEKKNGSPTPDYPLTKPVINNAGQVIGSSHHNVISEWTVDDPSADLFTGAHRELLRIEQPYRDHNMGQIAFNPNSQPGDEDYGLLYIAASDGGSDGFPVGDTDPLDMGQDLSTPLGAILRIDPQGNNSPNGDYGIPGSNPFASDGNAATLGEIWAYGVRNSHRMTWDTAGDGLMLISEIGQAFIEEINLGFAGANYGWGEREGTWVIREDNQNVLFPLPPNDVDFGFTYPVAQYAHPDGPGAIAGGIVYRGVAMPELYGHFVFADFTQQDRWFHLPVDSLQLGAQANIVELELRQPNNPDQITTFADMMGDPGNRTDVRFGVDADGEILIVNKRDGWVRRMIPPALDPSSTVLSIRVARASSDNGHSTGNTLDGNFDTRWSAEGEGEWIEFDLGGPQPIGQVRIAWFRGDQRQAFFNLEVSNDRTNWRALYTGGVSSGATTSLEAFPFEVTTARYVRYVGFGNSINAWNSVTEFRIHAP